MIDGFGGAHGIGPLAGIGRSLERDLVVLASSVSREHAELRQTETGWTVRDLGSRNGTFVNGVRVEGPVELAGGTCLKVGDVGLWFVSEVRQEPSSQEATETTQSRRGRLVRYHLDYGQCELSVVTSDDDTGPGALQWRAAGSETWSERSLTLLEFQLLRVLCRSARGDTSSTSSIRGCVPSKQLVNELPFQSKYANQENVRQVVLRLRTVLNSVGAKDMLAVATGRGYYLACRINAALMD